MPTPKEAVQLQRRLAERVERTTRHDWKGDLPATVAGCDMAVRGNRARAAICVFSFPDLTLQETRTAVRELSFPYIPGLLAFREVPALLAAFEKLRLDPALLLVDGHGLAHPRRCGIACHLGIELERPAIGCGKSLFVGEHRTPGPKRGARTQLRHKGELIGMCVRTRERVKPIYVSIGHRIGLEDAVRFVLRCTRKVRLPEPIRAADKAAGEAT